MSAVHLENLVKIYDTTTVVHGVNASFNPGEFVVIVGPSGCGKSTILRMIAGLEDISDGRIRINGEVVNGVEPKDRRIAMVFQNYALYPHMSVFNNMAYGLKLRGHDKKEIRRRVDEAARMLQLENLLERKPRQLSGGQRQRVAMGRALVRKPGVFLFDEPLSNLDAKLRHQMRVELKRLHRQLKTTMIYVTHDQVEAMTLADRIVVLNGGRIEQVGSPEEIYSQPVSTFVGGFIGSPPMNFLRATIDGSRLVLANGHQLALTAADRPQGPVIVGIRPENVDLSPEPHNGLRLKIDFIEKLGSGQLFYSHIGDDSFVVSKSGITPVFADTYWAAVAEDDLHFFAVDTGKRLRFVSQHMAQG